MALPQDDLKGWWDSRVWAGWLACGGHKGLLKLHGWFTKRLAQATIQASKTKKPLQA